MRSLFRPRVLLTGFTIGLLAWSFEGVGLALLTLMFPSTHIDVITALGIYGVAVLIGGLSFLPGGLGSTEAVMAALLATRGLALPDAMLITLTCRIVTLWLAVGLGWIAVLALRHPPVQVIATWP